MLDIGMDAEGAPTGAGMVADDPRGTFASAAGESVNDIHRIGGGGIDNLRLSSSEERLNPPGISVLKAATPEDASRQMIDAFPNATQLHMKAIMVGSTSEESVRRAGFQLFPNPTKRFSNHYRVTHSRGIDGFNDENLARLSSVFINVTLR